MTVKNSVSAEEQKKREAEELWLHYFNQTLFEAGLITEKERNRIIHLISYRSLSQNHPSYLSQHYKIQSMEEK